MMIRIYLIIKYKKILINLMNELEQKFRVLKKEDVYDNDLNDNYIEITQCFRIYLINYRDNSMFLEK